MPARVMVTEAKMETQALDPAVLPIESAEGDCSPEDG
jgi:hypothetical protein